MSGDEMPPGIDDFLDQQQRLRALEADLAWQGESRPQEIPTGLPRGHIAFMNPALIDDALQQRRHETGGVNIAHTSTHRKS